MSAKSLQTIVGVFIAILGFSGISPSVNEGPFSINNNRYYIEALFGVIELICGAIMIIGVFSYIRRATMHKAFLFVFIFWGLRVLVSAFVWGFPGNLTLASGLNWLLILSVDAIIASAIWLLMSTYKR